MRRAALALWFGLALCAPLRAGEVTAPGPKGDLSGTLLSAGDAAPVVLIVPGSGPTDRDGNNPLGMKAATYRLLAEGLAERGISSVRIDKRGMFGSASAVPDANAVTIADYASDVHAWARAIGKKTGASCIWVLGHSEGALVALWAAQQPAGICGVLLVAAPGRKVGDILRAQLEANPANSAFLPQALDAIVALEKGRSVDASALDPALQPLFATAVQPFLRDLLAIDPTRLIGAITVPALILQGESDLQTGLEDAQLLVAANPEAGLKLFPDTNHVLKSVPRGDTAANLASYADPTMPLSDGIIDTLADFIERHGPAQEPATRQP